MTYLNSFILRISIYGSEKYNIRPNVEFDSLIYSDDQIRFGSSSFFFEIEKSQNRSRKTILNRTYVTC